MYLGTGDPDYRMLIPNLMFRNAGGAFFQDVTSAGGFGHLQKGHGVSFGDVDGDGDQDLYHVVGGAFEGDTFPNALYLNPGHGNNWITLRLEGVASNRMAIGARIGITAAAPAGDREIHVTVGSGGSFGGSSLQQEIGLGDATGIRVLSVTWPASGRTDVYRNVDVNRTFRVREGDVAPAPVVVAPLALGPPDGRSLDTERADAEAHRERALDASGVGDWSTAIESFRQALALAPDDATLHLQLGMAIKLMGGAPDTAIGRLGEALRLDPLLTQARFAIGSLLEGSGRAAEAADYFRWAAEDGADGDEAAFRLAQILRRTGRPEASLSHYGRTIERSDARFGLALALVQLGRFSEARDRLRAGLELHPWEPAFSLALARLLAAAPDAAVRDGQRALDLVQALARNLRTTAVAETMAMAHAELGQFAEAVEWQRLAMSVATDAGQVEAVQRMSANLSLYLRGEPCRTPWHPDELG